MAGEFLIKSLPLKHRTVAISSIKGSGAVPAIEPAFHGFADQQRASVRELAMVPIRLTRFLLDISLLGDFDLCMKAHRGIYVALFLICLANAFLVSGCGKSPKENADNKAIEAIAKQERAAEAKKANEAWKQS